MDRSLGELKNGPKAHLEIFVWKIAPKSTNFVDFHCSAGLLLGHLHGGAKPSD